MKKFLDENFLLHNYTAIRLYHEYAAKMPIIDYHCHLPPDQIANDINFENITQAWLYGDHYKWRAMRANGIDESFCTGNKPDAEKFAKWAQTVPRTLRNPLYHWTHLELQRYFDVYDLLNESNAQRIYNECSEKLRSPEYSIRNLLRKMNVRVVCTTDDPADTLEFHKKLKEDGYEVKILPAFRPDKAMDVANLNAYIAKLEAVSNKSISTYNDFMDVLRSRHDFFASMGCTVSDHGLEQIYAEEYTEDEIKIIFEKIRSGKTVQQGDTVKFKSTLLYEFAVWDAEKNWVQQYHLGALRNNNARLFQQIGADTGTDSIGDFEQAVALSKFFNRLDKNNVLAKTILYNLNPADNEVAATMMGNFNDGKIPGKMQYGSAWWFLDQKDGMIKQINALSNMGLLGHFVGMLTDSRSFLSYPRHEYFRRILCNLFGEEIENGELPGDIDMSGKMIQDICFNNARNYFNF